MPEVTVPNTGATMVPGPNTPEPNTTKNVGTKTKGTPKAEVTKNVTTQDVKTEPQKQIFKTKINGQEKVFELTPDEIIVRLQKAEAADRKFEDAANLRKEADQKAMNADKLMNLFKTGTEDEIEEELSKLGRNGREMAEKILAKHLQKEMMDPREREIQELKAKLAKQAEKEKFEAEEKERTEKTEAEQKRIALLKDTLASRIMETLKESELPNDARTVGKIAFWIKHCVQNDVPFTVETVRDMVAKDYRAEIKHFFDNAQPQHLAEFLGEENIKKIRTWDNERVKGGKTITKPTNNIQPRKGTKKFKTPEQDNLERFGTYYPLPEID